MYTAAIIPVRNRPTLVVDAIASIRRQTHQLDEIIVVDDGSTDATPDVVTRLSQQDSRIRLVALAKSGGASAARNVGIDVSQCEYICFLDSDDQWMPQKNELQFHALKRAPEAVASFTGIRYQLRDQKIIDVSAPVHVTLEDLRRRNWLGSTSTAIIRRDALQQVGGFDSSLPSCQDWDLWIKLRRVGDFSIVPQPLIVFNQIEGPRISNCKTSVLAGHAQLFARALEGCLDRKERKVIAAYHQLRLTQIYLRDFREPAHAAVSGMKSIILHPTREGIALLLEACRVSISKLVDTCRR